MNYYSLRRSPTNTTQFWISIPTVDITQTAARAAKCTFSRASAPKSTFDKQKKQSEALQNQHTRVRAPRTITLFMAASHFFTSRCKPVQNFAFCDVSVREGAHPCFFDYIKENPSILLRKYN
jgi:hypothetical protein